MLSIYADVVRLDCSWVLAICSLAVNVYRVECPESRFKVLGVQAETPSLIKAREWRLPRHDWARWRQQGTVARFRRQVNRVRLDHYLYSMSAEASSSKASKKSRKSNGGDTEAEVAQEEPVEVNKNKRHRKEKRKYH